MLTSETITNIEEIESNHSFSVYPNPTNSQLNVYFHSNMLDKTYYIKSITGQVIKSERVSNSSININLSNLVSGPYFFSIEGQTSMFIKE